MTKQEREERIAHAKSVLHYYGVTEETIFYYSTHYTGNSGTALSRIYLVVDGGIRNVTQLVGNAIEGKFLTKDGRDYVRTTGYGYNRAQHITDSLSYALFGRRDALAYEEV
jgi:hypothetical protein